MQISSKKDLIVLWGIIIFFISIGGILYWFTFRHSYGDGFSNSIDISSTYANKKVMVIVPHEDDEINLAGATINRLRNNGNEVVVVYTTNGDFDDLGDDRINEAIDALEVLGVPEDNVIFLGYGDQWSRKGKHIYNSQDNIVVKSYIGRVETYGTKDKKDFRTEVSGIPSSYTRDNYKKDMMDVITTYYPDIIFAVDFDFHQDHRATSLIFEEALCEILKTDKAYNPKVYKGFAYSTAWYAKDDFYQLNLESTLLPSKSRIINPSYELDVPQYNWYDRVRFPVPKTMLSYTKRSNLLYKALKSHKSQNAVSKMDSVANSDEVFWERNTNSITYDAQVTVSSGQSKHINDLKLIDSSDIKKRLLIDNCVWIPEEDDAEKKVRVDFVELNDVSEVVLYDNFSLEDNILKGTLTFSDGSKEEVSTLEVNGSPTAIKFSTKNNIKYVEFKIDDYEGDNPGLCELEVYEKSRSDDIEYIKLMLNNSSQTFIYRYTVLKEKMIPIDIYAYPKTSTKLILDQCNVEINSNEITFENNTLKISDSINSGIYTVKVSLKENPTIFDEIEIFIPNGIERLYIELINQYGKILDNIDNRIESMRYRLRMSFN